MHFASGSFDPLFDDLAKTFRVDGVWETRQEPPPNSPAYLHVSKPTWGDENMNGIHLETYVLGSQLDSRTAPVALHCEAGCPFRSEFIRLFTERAAAEIKSWPGEYKYQVFPEAGSSVCEVSLPFRDTPTATVELIAEELRRLQTLAPLIDQTIRECQEADQP